MGKARNPETAGDWRHLTLSIALILAVAGTLVLGAVLQAGPERPRAAAAPTAPKPVEGPSDSGPPDAGAGAEATPAHEPSPPAPSKPGLLFSGDSDLVDRASEDERRLQASGNAYTLQFAVVCEPRNVRASLDALEGHAEFYVLTMLYRDRACFRLCWGFYDSEAQARADRDLPETLLRMTATPKVISVADALP